MKYWDEKSKKLLTKEELAKKNKKALEKTVDEQPQKGVTPTEDKVPMMGVDDDTEQETDKKSKK